MRYYINNPGSQNLIEEEISTRNSYFSFQSPDKISEALSLVSNKKIWKELEDVLPEYGTSSDIQTRLKIIVDRRNKIAHEADIDPSSPPSRWPITRQMTTESVEFIEKIGIKIYDIVK